MEEQFSRMKMLFGDAAIARLAKSRVAVFGIGGVGGYVAEALARSGIGELDFIDADVVAISNLNRQLIAVHSTIGRQKTEVMRERVLDINPAAVVHIYNCFFLPENSRQFPFEQYDYVVDAVDTVTAKIELVLRAQEAKVPIISCMGTGNKLDPTKFQVADIYKTIVCPRAKVMRHELKKRGVKDLKVVYSEEQPIYGSVNCENIGQEEAFCKDDRKDKQKETVIKRNIPGSIAFVPPAAGLILAGEVVKDLIAKDKSEKKF